MYTLQPLYSDARGKWYPGYIYHLAWQSHGELIDYLYESTRDCIDLELDILPFPAGVTDLYLQGFDEGYGIFAYKRDQYCPWRYVRIVTCSKDEAESSSFKETLP